MQPSLQRSYPRLLVSISVLMLLPLVMVSAQTQDWVAREQMTEEQLQSIPAVCCGAFIEPLREGVDANADPSNSETLLQTRQDFTQHEDGTITINGEVRIQQGNRTIENDNRSIIDKESETIQLDGRIIFREPGILLQGDRALIDHSTENSQIDNAYFVLHEAGIHGSSAAILYNSESGLMTIENGEFTRCEPESNFWRLEARSIVLDRHAGRGYATAAKIRLGDVPIFYYPFTLPFPLGDERVSGFLVPSIGSTREGGTDLDLPYYLNLAPHADATLTPRIISDRGVMASAELRYLSGWSMNTLNASYLGNDKMYQTSPTGVPRVDSPPTDKRWFLGLEQFGALGSNWSTSVDYNAVSDADYFRDLGSSGLNVASRTHLNRQARLDFVKRNFQAGLNLQRIQIIDPLLDETVAATDVNKPFDRLPQLRMATTLPLAGGLNFSMRGEFNHFDRELSAGLLNQTIIDRGALISGSRINLEPRLSMEFGDLGWFVRPAASYKYIDYQLDRQAVVSEDDPHVGVAALSLDAGLIFERPMNFSGLQYTQTLEPRLYYLNSEFEDQSLLPLFDTSEFGFSFNQLFRDDRFAGGDRIGDANQLTLAVSNRILDSSGRERASLSLGQIRYFEDRRVSLSNPLIPWQPRFSPINSNSALVTQFNYAFSEKWRLNLDAQWNDENQQMEEAAFRFRYQSANNSILNLGYHYRGTPEIPDFPLGPGIDPRIKQTDFSTAWPLNRNWRLLGRWNYDHSNSRTLETFGGVEYSNCCATIRLIAREWVHEADLYLPDAKPDRGVFFQFTLKGFGNITGSGLDGLLSDEIYGFRDYDQSP